MIFYKYMHKEFALDLLNYGKLRISLMQSYANNYCDNSSINDPQEGRFHAFGMYQTLTPDNCPKHLPINRSGLHGNIMRNCMFDTFFTIEECYVYCVSEAFSEQAMHEFGYDCALVIEDGLRFSRAMNWAMMPHAQLLQAGSCVYVNEKSIRYEHIDEYAYLIKPKEYASQREARFVYTPVYQNPLPYIDLQSLFLRKAFKPYFGF